MTDVEPNDVAIVGMSGRFPGAVDVEELWRRVAAGDDCLVDLDLPTLAARGVPASVALSPGYVRRTGVLEGVDRFDSEFFGIGPRDAAIMDPQHRHFLECSWEVLEQACVDPQRTDRVVGVFAGCGMNTYLLNNLLANPDLLERMGWFLLRHTGNDKDFLATGVSYRLDLRGPSITVQTACSTSLVAVHLAAQSLLAFECDVAIAGGATIEVPHGVGYRHHEGEVLSPDGHCRAFDADSGGTVLTSGAAAVALMRLSDALAAGNEVLAVVKGSAVNNDGNRKVSFLAPSVDGHADVVKEALAVAGLGARDIQLLEAHGTGTAVGDPIEVAALTEAFRATTDDVGFCRLVSTKPNIGHLDTAAGTASLVKVVQALRHRTLPPLANHTAPSPLLDLARTPFVLSAEAAPWPGDAPRRAGVSSLGVGGTNAHVVVEEAPQRDPLPVSSGEQTLVLSGRDGAAVDAAAGRLADALSARPDLDLGDVAHTLARGRHAFAHRRAVVARDLADAVTVLRSAAPGRVASGVAPEIPPRLAFVFPGGGAQYARMAAGLDARFSEFHRVIADGAALVRSLSGVDLAAHLVDPDGAGLERPEVSLPAVFLTSVALARQWIAWGAEPDALAGHSLGEYAAAHLAGVLSFEDAVGLVVVRARLMGEVGADAAMLVVSAPETMVTPLTGERLSLAVVNADDECVLAGDRSAVEAARDRLAADGVESTFLPLAAAAHSVLLDPVLDEFRAAVAGVRLSPPTRRYLSNRTGTWIAAEQATDPDYWVEHLRHTVRFREALETLLGEAPTVTVELGPGQALSSYARRCAYPPVAALAALRHPRQQIDDTAHTLHVFARQWVHGVAVDPAVTVGSDRRFVVLPTYPFQRERHWIDPPAIEATTAGIGTGPVETPVALTRIDDPSEMCWVPEWVPVIAAPRTVEDWDVVSLAPSAHGLAEEVATVLSAAGCGVRRMGADAGAVLDHDATSECRSEERAVALVAGPAGGDLAESLSSARVAWLCRARDVVRSLGSVGASRRVVLVSAGGRAVGRPAAHPAESLALGLALVARREYPHLDVVALDVSTSPTADRAEALTTALLGRHGEPAVAERDGRLLRVNLQPVPAPQHDRSSPFTTGGTYLVTGGLGAVGHALASHLATTVGARLVLVTTTPLPEGAARDAWRATHGPEDPVSARLDRLASLEALGGQVHVLVGDVADVDRARQIVADAVALVGPIDGIVHAAGALADGLIERTTDADIELVVGAKAAGAVGLVAGADDHGVPLVMLVSSTSTQLSPAGQMAYVAANSVLDASAGRGGGVRVVTIGLGAVQGLGMADRAAKRARLGMADGAPVEHPVFEEIARRPRGVVEVNGHLGPAHHWIVDEHRTADGTAVLPGSAHLDLLLAATVLATGEGPLAVDDVQLITPLNTPDGGVTLVQVRLEADGTVELRSDGGPATGWVVHSTACVRRLDPADEPSPDRPEDGWPGHDDASGHDDALGAQRAHLRLGPRWSSPVTVVDHGDRVDARVALVAAHRVDLSCWRAHPALVDLAIGLGVRLWSSHHATDRLVAPIGAAAVESWHVLPDEVLVRSCAGDGGDTVDLDLLDVNGVLCLRIRGLRLWAVADDALRAPPPVASLSGWQDDLRGGRGFARMPRRSGCGATTWLLCSTWPWLPATTMCSCPVSTSRCCAPQRRQGRRRTQGRWPRRRPCARRTMRASRRPPLQVMCTARSQRCGGNYSGSTASAPTRTSSTAVATHSSPSVSSRACAGSSASGSSSATSSTRPPSLHRSTWSPPVCRRRRAALVGRSAGRAVGRPRPSIARWSRSRARARAGRCTSSTGRAATSCSSGGSHVRWRAGTPSTASRPRASMPLTCPTRRWRPWHSDTWTSCVQRRPVRT